MDDAVLTSTPHAALKGWARGMHQKQDPNTMSIQERNWVVSAYFSPEIQATLNSGSPKFLSQAVDDVFHRYRLQFGGPRPAESEAAFKKRRRNARGVRKTQIIPFPAETVADVEGRMTRARAVSCVVWFA